MNLVDVPEAAPSDASSRWQATACRTSEKNPKVKIAIDMYGRARSHIDGDSKPVTTPAMTITALIRPAICNSAFMLAPAHT